MTGCITASLFSQLFLEALPTPCAIREGAKVWIGFGYALVLLWICFGFNLDTIWTCFGSELCPNSLFRLSDEYLVLESFWTCFGFRLGFGSNLDLDWSRLAPSLLAGNSNKYEQWKLVILGHPFLGPIEELSLN